MHRAILIGALLLAACHTAPDTSKYRPVVVICQRGNAGVTCTRPLWAYSSGQTWNLKGCRDMAADYNKGHFIPQKAMCLRVRQASRAGDVTN